MPLLGCGDFNGAVSEPFGNVGIIPRMTFYRKLTILYEYDEAACYAIGTTQHERRITHDPFRRKAVVPDRKEIAAASIIIGNKLPFAQKHFKLLGRKHACREKT